MNETFFLLFRFSQWHPELDYIPTYTDHRQSSQTFTA